MRWWLTSYWSAGSESNMTREICKDFQEEGRKVGKREVSLSHILTQTGLRLPLISRLAVMQGRCITVEFSAALLSTFSILKVSPQSWVSLDYSLPSPGSPLIILFPLPQSLHLVELD